MDLLMNKGAAVNKNDEVREMFFDAISSSLHTDYKITDVLLKAWYDVNMEYEGISALFHALFGNFILLYALSCQPYYGPHGEIIMMLLKAGMGESQHEK